AEDPDPMSIDIETTGVDPWTIDITRIGFANSTLAISVPWCDWQGVNGVRPERTPLDAAIVEATKTALVGGQLKIFQNGIFDRTTFRVHGIECRGPYFDTLYAHQLYSPGTPHDLGFQAGQEFWVPAWKQE